MNLPLEGKKVLVTRGANQAKELTKLISKFGGIPLQVPLLTYKKARRVDNKKIISHLQQFDWIFFTSTNGVHFFMELLQEEDVSIPKHIRIGSVGKKTAEGLEQYGVPVHFIPTIYNADSMVEELPIHKDEDKVLLVQGNRSRDVLPAYFEAEHIAYQPIVVYETASNELVKKDLEKVLGAHDLDIITFTSPSCVEAFFELGGLQAEYFVNTLCLCIGTTTEKAARAAGFENTLTPNQFTVVDMMDALIQFLQKEHEKNE
ncbi:uroporphyrinogen-III synthase [Salirhabdus sp. Marseille-P4669]|uniref:uroporphyrinogen-III synthase n=1 Tax=Salirhabdus sp. Marseille-P4669 TaxID=2042310 RepID=UPI000C7CA28B|nr:uroporphyrinogen-III synthase [Salirhabdus sp. Marseille-P4669]